MYSDPPHNQGPTWEGDVALFVDWEHLAGSLRRRGMEPDIERLIEAASAYGRLVKVLGYADWQGSPHLETGEQRMLTDVGVEPVYVPTRQDPDLPSRRIDHVEVKITADVLDSSYITPQIGTYVLASGLSHFPHLTRSLRQRGFRVVYIGVSWNRPHRMGDKVDHFHFYDQEWTGEREGHTPNTGGPQDDLDHLLEDLTELVREQRAQGRYPLLSWLGHQLRRQNTGFSPQAYGFDRFKDLIRHAELLGLIKVVTHGLQDWAMLPEDDVDRTTSLDDSTPTEVDPEKPVEPFIPVNGPHPVIESEKPLEEYRDVFEDLVRTADELETDPRYGFMTPGFLGQCLWRKGHWDLGALPPGATPASATLKQLRAGQIRKLVDFAVEIGLLLSTTQFDPDTRKTFTTVHLRRTNPFVKKALSYKTDSTTHPTGSTPDSSPATDDDSEGDYGDSLQESAG